jgi:hypothetical protein
MKILCCFGHSDLFVFGAGWNLHALFAGQYPILRFFNGSKMSGPLARGSVKTGLYIIFLSDCLDNAALLQVDITAKVGIFIFLTIEELALGPTRDQRRRTRWLFTPILAIPFAVSALVILIEDNWSSNCIVKWVQNYANIPMISAIRRFFVYPVWSLDSYLSKLSEGEKLDLSILEFYSIFTLA